MKVKNKHGKLQHSVCVLFECVCVCVCVCVCFAILSIEGGGREDFHAHDCRLFSLLEEKTQ